MPMKLLKTERDNQLIVERILHAKSYSLTLDKAWCTGCGICAEVCPREAIKIIKFLKGEGERAKPPTVDIDEQKCQYCGICNTLCPFGALVLRINGELTIPVVEKESFPKLIREIQVNVEKCDVKCEELCPLNLIKVSVGTPEGEGDRVLVDLDRDHCPCCRVCEIKGPEGAFHVSKFLLGIIRINHEKCPEGCHDCLDVCPITGTLYLSDDGKVYVNDAYCVYCGACKIVCPQEGALELERTYIRHTPVRSGAWNKALEKLTSTREMTKELRAKGLIRTRESLEKRLLPTRRPKGV